MALIVDDLLTLPFKGFWGIFKEIHKYVDRELNDVNYWQQKLLELQVQHETGEIDTVQFEAQEKAIVYRILEIQEQSA